MTVQRIVSQSILRLKKDSPKIFLGLGIAGGIVTVIAACKATTKANDIFEKAKEDLNKINEASKTLPKEEYSKMDKVKDLTIVYTQTTIKVVKHYRWPILIGAASIASLLGSHHIIAKRYLTLGAAYAATLNDFREYRAEVIKKYGPDADMLFRLKDKIAAKDEEKINETKKDSDASASNNTCSDNKYSIYARCFDETCSSYKKSAEHNLVFIKNVENWANDTLRRRGYLFLNEVYRALGLPETKIGHNVGWLYDEKKSEGDRVVDFHIYDLNDKNKREFINGHEPAIWLDFNVDGDIYHLMDNASFAWGF